MLQFDAASTMRDPSTHERTYAVSNYPQSGDDYHIVRSKCSFTSCTRFGAGARPMSATTRANAIDFIGPLAADAGGVRLQQRAAESDLFSFYCRTAAKFG